MEKVTCHRARLLMQAPGRWIQNGVACVSQGRILEIGTLGKKQPPGILVDHGAGILMPALVNAHTHLSLSSLHGRLDTSKGFLCWVESLIRERSQLSLQEAQRSAQEAMGALRAMGVGLVGEFGPFFPIQEQLLAQGLEGVVWEEFLGGEREVLPPAQTCPGILLSLAGHAPHTTSPLLLRRLKALCSRLGLPFSMHLAESQQEVEFLQTGRGDWALLLEKRGLEFRNWDCFGASPVALAQRLGLLGPGTLLVHLIHVSQEEVGLLARSRVGVCVCPRSNWNLHKALPRLPQFLEAGLSPALGTDSLASVESLNLFEEMRFTACQFPELKPADILRMATLNGARALGRPDLGMLEEGHSARMIYVELDAPDPPRAEETLLYDLPQRIQPVGW